MVGILFGIKWGMLCAGKCTFGKVLHMLATKTSRAFEIISRVSAFAVVACWGTSRVLFLDLLSGAFDMHWFLVAV